MPIKTCVYCGNNFEARKYATSNRYCSDRCRFMEIASTFVGKDGCWEWPLSMNPRTGYGQLRAKNPFTGNVEPVGAHRLSYLFFNGKMAIRKSVWKYSVHGSM